MIVPKEHKVPMRGLEVPKEGDGGLQGWAGSHHGG